MPSVTQYQVTSDALLSSCSHASRTRRLQCGPVFRLTSTATRQCPSSPSRATSMRSGFFRFDRNSSAIRCSGQPADWKSSATPCFKSASLPGIVGRTCRRGPMSMMWRFASHTLGLMERILGSAFSEGGCKTSAFWSACTASPPGLGCCLSSGIAPRSVPMFSTDFRAHPFRTRGNT